MMMDPYAGIGGLVKFMSMYGLLAWFMCGAFSSHVASEKGRCAICWFLWGIGFGPMALLAVVGLPDKSRPREVELPPTRDRAEPTI